MTKHSAYRVLRISFLSTILALLVVLCLAFTVSAKTTALSKGVNPAAKVTVDIIKRSSGYEFSPSTVHVHPSTDLCAANLTSITQKITARGHTIFTIAPHKTYCAPVGGKGTFHFHLKSNPKATLTVIST